MGSRVCNLTLRRLSGLSLSLSLSQKPFLNAQIPRLFFFVRLLGANEKKWSGPFPWPKLQARERHDATTLRQAALDGLSSPFKKTSYHLSLVCFPHDNNGKIKINHSGNECLFMKEVAIARLIKVTSRYRGSCPPPPVSWNNMGSR